MEHALAASHEESEPSVLDRSPEQTRRG